MLTWVWAAVSLVRVEVAWHLGQSAFHCCDVMLEKSDLKGRLGLGSWVLRFQSMVAGLAVSGPVVK